ncbi:MAG: SGNH/GDSL hydrolase family protein [Muricoprocola sp.]
MSTFLFLGDSITDAEHLWLPEYQNLGNGFVYLLQNHFTSHGLDYKCINKGQDGFTTSALLRILSQVLEETKPDFIHLLIGINDVGVAMNTGTTLEKLHFAENFHCILDQLSQSQASLLCSGPFLFPHPARRIHWMPSVTEAENIIKKQTEEKGIPFLPLHADLNELALQYGYDAVTTDGIHLTSWGHEILTEKILRHIIL